MKLHVLGVAVLVVGLCGSSPVAQAQFDQLVSRIPPGANSLVLLNVDKVMNSPAAVNGHWKEEQSASYAAGLTFLPPHASSAVLATYFDLEQMSPDWSVAVVALDHDVSVPAIEQLAEGKAEQMNSHPVIKLAGEGYLVQFAPRLLAAISPATRQTVGRWIRDVDDAGGELSPYLQDAYRFANQIGTPVILALDLQDIAPVSQIRESLAASTAYASADAATLDRLAALLASVRGITLGITMESDEPFGKVKVDFAEPVFLSPDEAKALLLDALAKRGAMLNELEQWSPKVADRTISLEGYLSPSGMRRISSLFDRPPAFKPGVDLAKASSAHGLNVPPPPAPAKPAATGQANAASQTSTASQTAADSVAQTSVQASQEYLKRVSELIEDLRKKPQRSSNYTMGSIALWCDTFARKIDQLPTMGVDPELSNFAAFASDSMRAASSAIRDSYARKRARQTATPVPYDYYTYNTTYGYSARWNIFGGYAVPWGSSITVPVPDYRAYQQARTAISTQERVTGANQARDILAKVDDAEGDIRRRMAEKYRAPF
ncbi:MAG: hypothetical protein AB7F89_06530 [Pirellulaceae bacterium]